MNGYWQENLAHWLAKLQQCNFDIVHRPGAQQIETQIGLSPALNGEMVAHEYTYAYSCGGSSLDSELIPLESGETCVAAIMTAQSENSKLIIAAQKIDKDISIVREWILAGKFSALVGKTTTA